MKKQKIIPIERFGIYTKMSSGLNELADKQLMKIVENSLIRKPLQLKNEKDTISIMLSSIELIKLKIDLNGECNKQLEMLLAKQARLSYNEKKEVILKMSGVTIATLKLVSDSKTRKIFIVIDY